MFHLRGLTRSIAATTVAVAVTVLTATAAPPAPAKGVATVTAAEYRHIDDGMTMAQVHKVVGGAPKSVSTSGKHTTETFRGWDHARHALVRVTYKVSDGKPVVSGKSTKSSGGGGGGGGGGGCQPGVICPGYS